jgi:UDP-glucose 4-epimerase
MGTGTYTKARSGTAPLARSDAGRLARIVPRKRVIAVSGASSFLGRNLVGLLESDESASKIVAVDVQSPRTAGSKTRFYQLDLTQPAVDSRLAEILGAEEVDTFVHLAFLSSPSQASAWAHELESVGTMHVLNACRERRIGKFILRSQTALYGAHASNPNFLTENHPVRGLPGTQFLADKIEAEKETRKFAQSAPDSCVTILRFAPVLGPTANNFLTQWLSRRFVPTVLGFDPLLQFVHEMDALAALKLAIARDVPGTFNVIGDGVLPVSTVVKLAGRMALPLPWPLLRQLTALGWAANAAEVPPSFLAYLRFLCVADGERAAAELGFRAAYTTREAVLDFGGALRLRDARLLHDAP